MDNEFEKVKDHVPTDHLNTPAASKHIGKIEHCIRVIKERSCRIIYTLTYARLTQQMLIHVLYHIVMWLNNVLVSNCVSNQFNPRELILWHKLDYNYHCRAPFGAYCEVHENNTPTNSMKTGGTPSICLGPTRNMQGTYNFLSLRTGLVIKCRCLVKLPAPDSVIKQVATLAGNSGISPNLIFMDLTEAPFDWPDNNPCYDGLDPSLIAAYPDIQAEMPGVLIAQDHAIPTLTSSTPRNNKPDWSQLANEAAMNANLDFMAHLPPPPEVIETHINNDLIFIPPANSSLLIKQESYSPPKVKHDSTQAPHAPSI